MSFYRPVLSLSIALEWPLFRLAAGGYVAVNAAFLYSTTLEAMEGELKVGLVAGRENSRDRRRRVPRVEVLGARRTQPMGL